LFEGVAAAAGGGIEATYQVHRYGQLKEDGRGPGLGRCAVRLWRSEARLWRREARL